MCRRPPLCGRAAPALDEGERSAPAPDPLKLCLASRPQIAQLVRCYQRRQPLCERGGELQWQPQSPTHSLRTRSHPQCSAAHIQRSGTSALPDLVGEPAATRLPDTRLKLELSSSVVGRLRRPRDTTGAPCGRRSAGELKAMGAISSDGVPSPLTRVHCRPRLSEWRPPQWRRRAGPRSARTSRPSRAAYPADDQGAGARPRRRSRRGSRRPGRRTGSLR
jgi:hypothetical protein